MAFFPTLVMGPIMRYAEFQQALESRTHTADGLASGMRLFIAGLSKKIMLAAPFGVYVDKIWAAPPESIAVATAWFGAFGYLIQLYFDFSGYSDMAIGMGRMFGIGVPKNFDYPYVSSSVTEFWRRWHITLGTWFRDYLYAPMLRKFMETRKLPIIAADIMSLLVLWSFVGIWHGAGVKFLAYGLLWFAFIAIERIYAHYAKKRRKRLKIKGALKAPVYVKAWEHFYVLAAVLFIQVVFRAPSLHAAIAYFRMMLSAGPAGVFDGFSSLIAYDMAIISVLSVVLSTPIIGLICNKLHAASNTAKNIMPIVQNVAMVVLLLACMGYLFNADINPFLYEQF